MSDQPHLPSPAGRVDEEFGADHAAMARLLDRPLTDDLLHEVTERVAQPRSQATRQLASVLLFRLGDEQLAVPATDVARVAPVSVVRRIPHRGNRILRGFCNLDGELVLCGSLEVLLDLPGRQPASATASNALDAKRMVALGPEAKRWVVEVDCVLGLQYFETALCKPPPITVRQAMRCFAASILPGRGSEVATLLDVPQVLSGFEAALT
jgi:chemotaxis-related protein WspD